VIEAELPVVVAMALLVGVLGSAVGSFLNVVAHRVPRGLSVVNPPSACPDCGTGIRSRHNVPVVGWLVLRGRCYDCGSSISARYPLVEAGIAALFVLAALRFADAPRLLPAYLAFAGIGGALALIDLDVRRLPNSIVLPSYPVLGVLLALDGDARALLRAALGAALLFVFYLVVAMVAVGAMGFGDVKLAGVIGGMTAYLSWGTLLSGAFLGFFLGAVAGLLLIAVRRAGRRSAVPFGPFMLLGAWTAVLGAGYLGDYYLALLAG
jgi:leader peptidase (prepilin peptidase)/N-methyltransferase